MSSLEIGMWFVVFIGIVFILFDKYQDMHTLKQ